VFLKWGGHRVKIYQSGKNYGGKNFPHSEACSFCAQTVTADNVRTHQMAALCRETVRDVPRPEGFTLSSKRALS
jgi:hypothetical protein